MIYTNRWLPFIIKIYPVGALLYISIRSTPVLATAPIVLLAVYLLLWRWPVRYRLRALVYYFIYFAIAVLSAPVLGPYYSLLLVLPVLFLLDISLQESVMEITCGKSRFTGMAQGLFIIALLSVITALVLDNLALLLSSSLAVIALVSLALRNLRRIPDKPVKEAPFELRVLAVNKIQTKITLTAVSPYTGRLFFEADEEWLQIVPDSTDFRSGKAVIELTLVPPLAGSASPLLKCTVADRWGLTVTRCTARPVRLNIIPKARYAAWLANRYLNKSGTGTLASVSNTQTLQPPYGGGSGIEYYGSYLYQSGDSLKTIDWKHSLTHNELISKKYTNSSGTNAVILVNLVAGNAREADDLAYRLVTAAMTLATENIPAVLAVYDETDSGPVTPVLSSRELVKKALNTVKDIQVKDYPARFLDKQDIGRLLKNISSLRSVPGKAAAKLGLLLQAEYENLSAVAIENPAFETLKTAMRGAGKGASYIIISRHNHDAEALALYLPLIEKNSSNVVPV